MYYYGICALLGFLTGVPCALYIYFHKPRSQAKIIWSIYSLLLSVWSLGIFLFCISVDRDNALFLARINNFLDLYIPISFFAFVLALTSTFTAHKKAFITYLFITIFYSIVSLIGYKHYIVDVAPIMNFNFYPKCGPIYLFFPLILFFIYSHGYLILYQSYKKASAIRRNQYKYFALASGLWVLGASTAFFLVFGIHIYPFGQFTLPLHDWLIVYIIAKYHLLDIRLVIRKGLIYTLLAAIISMVYFVVIYLIERLFQNILGYQSLMGTLAALLLIGVLFVPLKEYIQSFVDKYFFKASYMQILEQNDFLRQQVVRADRYETMSTLSKRIIDELRNPLTALVGYGYQLPKRLQDQEFLDKFILVFDREIIRIQDLIKQLSDFSELKSLDLKPVDIITIIDEVLEHLSPQVKEKNILFYKYYREDKELLIKADREQIKKAFYIFLVKSIRSTAAYGQIWVGVEDSMEGLEISIKDTGVGLSPEELARVFDPLTALTKTGEDTQANLAQAQNIISHHGGKVLVDSQINLGTEWIIQIPRLT